jgi:CHRD domain
MKKEKEFIEVVLPKVFSFFAVILILSSLAINTSASILVIKNGKIVKQIEVEAAITGNPLNGLTPTGIINSGYFPDAIGQGIPLVTDSAVINNLSLPVSVSEIGYFLNNSAAQRSTFFRLNEPNSWGGTILQIGNTARIAPGTTVQVKSSNQVVGSGTFIRPLRNYEPYDTALLGRFVVPPVVVTGDEIESLAIIKYFPEQNRLNYDVLVFGVPEACSGITLNSGAEGFNGPVVASLPFLSSSSEGNFSCSSEGNITLTNAQAALLRNNSLYLSVQTASNPNGIQRGQLENSFTEGDFRGDRTADLAVFRPSNGAWYIQDVQTNQFTGFAFGSSASKVFSNDFDGDAISDPAIFEPARGIWTIRKSSENTERQIQWGAPTDIPLTGRYFGKGSDIAVFRPSEGVWYVRRCGDIIKPFAENINASNYEAVRWGQNGDKPLMADFNGDGRDELAVYRPSNGTWYILDPRTRSTTAIQWGLAEDIPLAADYDGDRKADVAVFRPSNGTWYVFGSAERRMIASKFGQNGDIPATTDYDKDGVSDVAVFRPSNGFWYIVKSSDNSFYAARFGTNGDVPIVAQ